MADIKISALPTATTPLTGAELVPIVQSGVTKQTTTSDVLAAPVTSLTASSAVATDASKKLVSVTNTGTGNNVLATGPTLVAPALGTPASGVVTNLTGTASININGTVGATTPASVSATSLTDSGNLTFTGTGNRITGDFSNATIANRVYVQTSTSGGNTSFGLLPHPANATPVTTFEACLSSDTANSNVMQAQVTTTDVRFNSGARGTSTYLPMTFYTGGSERVRVDTSGNVGIGTASPSAKLDVAGSIVVTSAALLGYGTGSGGTVTQATSKSTAVTLNKPTGQISVNNSALGANVSAVFTFNNTLISASDVLLISRRSNGIALDSYSIDTMCGSGVAYVAIRNITSGSLSESLELSFAVIKGSTT